MTVDWVAGSARARAMLQRRIGLSGTREIARLPSLEPALRLLEVGPYGRGVRRGQSLAEAQRGVVDALMWNWRVLAAWLPRAGVAMLRTLAAGAEAANVDDRLLALSGADVPPPVRLGALATAWPRLAAAATPDELRRALATSAWGDPAAESPAEIALFLRLSLADRTIAAVPAAAKWASGAAALLLASQHFVTGRLVSGQARHYAVRVLGDRAVETATLPEFVAALPASARWALAGVADPAGLWHAGTDWWHRLGRDGGALVSRPVASADVPVGCVAAMAADAWRLRAALESADRGGTAEEILDAVG